MSDEKQPSPKPAEWYRHPAVIGLIGGVTLSAIVVGGNYIYKEYADPARVVIETDKYSQKTVINTPNQVPETANGEDYPILGFDRLIDIGVGYDQVLDIKAELSGYASINQIDVNRISLDTDSITDAPNPENGIRKINFNIIIKHNLLKTEYTLKVEVSYFGVRKADITLTEPETNKVIYDSASTN